MTREHKAGLARGPRVLESVHSAVTRAQATIGEHGNGTLGTLEQNARRKAEIGRPELRRHLAMIGNGSPAVLRKNTESEQDRRFLPCSGQCETSHPFGFNRLCASEKRLAGDAEELRRAVAMPGHGPLRELDRFAALAVRTQRLEV